MESSSEDEIWSEEGGSEVGDTGSDEAGNLALLEVSSGHSWSKLYEKDKYYDVLLIVDGEERGAHKVVLACVSEFFDKMFTSGLKEGKSQENPLRVPLKDIALRTLDNLLELIYKAQVQTNYEATLLLARAAHMYRIRGALWAASESLCKRISMRNFVELWEFAYLLNMDELYTRVGRFANVHVVDICQSSDLPAVPLSLLKRMLQSVSSQYLDERLEDICEGIMDWVNTDPKRTPHIDELLEIALEELPHKTQEESLSSIGQTLLHLCDKSSAARNLVSSVISRLEVCRTQYQHCESVARCKRCSSTRCRTCIAKLSKIRRKEKRSNFSDSGLTLFD